ncbi:DBH-like monooxygenase protein 1 [Chionoecetes opilio]|uniref:DBH-like monooxygenase protein 1 n=1 Tax=Chionoecetes opilio TaxID=41210 RepID=A0A8J4Y6A3_CHIOP|nr:DBH-like monooxygenase protein 1 [Chionoecetes opilio]
MDCGYNSMHRPVTTYGGLGTKEEMCVAFMSYYPRIDLSYCGSQPQLDTVLNALGIEQATNKDKVSEMDVEAENQLLEKRRNGTLSIGAEPMIFAQVLDMINVTAPQKFFNRSLYNILNDRATWAEGGATAALQRAVLEGKHHPICHMNGDGIFRRGDTVITAPSLKPLPSTMPEVTFMHTLVLDTQGSFLMLWTPREDDIVFEIQVGTTGYVGLGFSPTGGMTGADIVLGWVDDNDQDTYAEANGAPTIDNSQDVTLLGGYQNATHTVIRFSRPWNTCDGEQDYILSEDTVRVIWAYSGRDPTDARRLHYHDARGTKSLYLQSPQFELPAMGPDVKTWDFLSPNVSLPEDLDTLYWCKIYKIPPMPRKSHMIGTMWPWREDEPAYRDA